MRPRRSSDDLRDSGFRYACNLSDNRIPHSSLMQVPDAVYLIRCQHMLPAVLPACWVRYFRSVVTVFRETILHIILGGSQEEMVRTNARRGVATMADEHAGRDLAVVKYPRKAVGKHVSIASQSQTGIPAKPDTTLPEPTSFSFCDLRPKSLFIGMLAVALAGAMRLRRVADVFGKRRLTGGANLCHPLARVLSWCCVITRLRAILAARVVAEKRLIAVLAGKRDDIIVSHSEISFRVPRDRTVAAVAVLLF